MAKLSRETRQTLWRLKDQLLDLVDEAKALEFSLFERFGETNETMTATITTIVKMVESLPDALQERVAEHICDGDVDIVKGNRKSASIPFKLLKIEYSHPLSSN
jgi:phage host-nuclease inhibitor protein Gam